MAPIAVTLNTSPAVSNTVDKSAQKISVDVNKGGYTLESLYPQYMRDKQIKGYEDKVTTATKNLVAEQDKLDALSDLKTLSTNLQNALNSLAVNGSTNDVYNHKQATINTNDTGNGSDYVNVTTTSEASIGQINVQVNKVAKAAKFVTAPKTLLNQSNMSRVELKIDSGEIISIALTPNDDFQTIYNKIIDVGKKSQRFSAYISTDNSNPGNGQLVIKASKSGFQDDANAAFTNQDGNIAQPVSIDQGQDAQIELDGITKTSSSNVFQNIIPGVTIEAKKVNNGGADLTVDVKQNVEQIVSSIVDFTTAFNELSKFVDTQSQYEKKNGNFVPSDEAKLHMTASLRYAKEILLSSTQVVSGISKKVLSLKDIGIENVSSKNGVEINNGVVSLRDKSFGKLVINDQQKLLDVCNNRPEVLRELFVGRVEVKNISGTNGILSLYNLDKNVLISSKVIGEKILLHDDGAGNITLTINGVSQNAKYNGSNLLTFEGTDLEGLMMYYQPDTSGVAEDFDIENLVQGLARKDIIKIDQLNKQIDLESSLFGTKVDRLEDIKTKAQNELVTAQRKIDESVLKLEFLINQFNEFSDKIDSWSELFD